MDFMHTIPTWLNKIAIPICVHTLCPLPDYKPSTKGTEKGSLFCIAEMPDIQIFTK